MSAIRKHVQDHKQFYIGVGMGLGVAGITVLIMRNPRIGRIHDPSGGLDVFTTLPQGVSHSFNTTTVVDSFNNTYIHGVKRLSYIVRQSGTENWWRSQADAARALDISTSALSKHLNHGDPIIGRPDLSFVREGVSSAM